MKKYFSHTLKANKKKAGQDLFPARLMMLPRSRAVGKQN